MERTPMTKEEIALELVKLITPTDRPPVIISSIDSNSTKVANAYKKILKAISETPKDWYSH